MDSPPRRDARESASDDEAKVAHSADPAEHTEATTVIPSPLSSEEKDDHPWSQATPQADGQCNIGLIKLNNHLELLCSAHAYLREALPMPELYLVMNMHFYLERFLGGRNQEQELDDPRLVATIRRVCSTENMFLRPWAVRNVMRGFVLASQRRTTPVEVVESKSAPTAATAAAAASVPDDAHEANPNELATHELRQKASISKDGVPENDSYLPMVARVTDPAVAFSILAAEDSPVASLVTEESIQSLISRRERTQGSSSGSHPSSSPPSHTPSGTDGSESDQAANSNPSTRFTSQFGPFK